MKALSPFKKKTLLLLTLTGVMLAAIFFVAGKLRQVVTPQAVGQGPTHEADSAEKLFQESFEQAKNQIGEKHGLQSKTSTALAVSEKNSGFPLNPLPPMRSLMSKMDDWVRLDVENRRLRIENMNLREWSEALAYDCRAIHAEKKTQDLEMDLSDRTGALVGRLLESVDYRPPHDKSGVELYTLGASYFKDQDFERAAVIFAYLIRAKKFEKFRTPEAFLTAGVSLYKIDHFKLADHQFAEVLLSDNKDESSKHYKAQARLWRGIIADRLDDYSGSQNWLKTLVDHHPHSVEAAWINGENVERLPGSTFNPESIVPLNEEDIIEAPEAPSSTGSSGGDHDGSEVH